MTEFLQGCGGNHIFSGGFCSSIPHEVCHSREGRNPYLARSFTAGRLAPRFALGVYPKFFLHLKGVRKC